MNMITIKGATKSFLDTFGIPIYWMRQNVWELHACWVRLWSILPVQKFRMRKILKQNSVRLNFGCGATHYESWVGVDQIFSRNVSLVLDLRRPLPFPEESVDLCYSEHFLEHLYPEEGQRHLKEVCRILRPSGRYRVAVPDVMKFVQRYLAGDDAFFCLAFPWANRPMEAVYAVANWAGEHRNILDFAELEYLGKIAGFDVVVRSEANTSDIPELRIDKADPQRVAESLYLEFIKRDSPR
jgi:predicted SAM-dependent methyltransferase